jgi:hypothetical protein
VYRLHDQKNQDNSFNFRFQIGNDRQSKRLLANLGRILFFHFFFLIKTGIQDFLLDIYNVHLCIAKVFDDHRSCQKLINYITNIKAKSKRYHWIQKIPVLKRLFIQNFCKRSRCLEENPVFLAVYHLHNQKKIG